MSSNTNYFLIFNQNLINHRFNPLHLLDNLQVGHLINLLPNLRDNPSPVLRLNLLDSQLASQAITPRPSQAVNQPVPQDSPLVFLHLYPPRNLLRDRHPTLLPLPEHCVP